MGDLLQPMHLLVIAIILLVLFGARRLPELGKGLGEGLKGFKEGLKGITDPSPVAPTAQQTVTPAPPPVSTPIQPASANNDMTYITCSRCGSRFENPHGFPVANFVCRSCQGRS
jgi:sec-independent protein translocase protein TatA